MILLPSKNKYLKFKNSKNTIKHDFIVFSDIESYMLYQDKNIYKHDHLMSGYYLHCLDKNILKSTII